MTSWVNPITANTSCVSKLGTCYVYRCYGWIFGNIDVTLNTTCTNIYTAYLLGTINKDCRPNAFRSCLTIVSTDEKAGNGNPWVDLHENGKLYLNVRNTSMAWIRSYIFFIAPE